MTSQRSQEISEIRQTHQAFADLLEFQEMIKDVAKATQDRENTVDDIETLEWYCEYLERKVI